MSVVASAPRVFRSTRAVLGESIWWDPEGELVWVSINDRRVFRSPLDGEVGGSDDEVFETPSAVGFVVPTWDGRLALGLKDGVYQCDADGGALEPLVPIDQPAETVRMNDGNVDPLGRLVFGSQNEGRDEPIGSLYIADVTGDFRVLREGFRTPNGPAWSLDGGTVYFADTGYDRLFVADWHEDGTFSDERLFREGHHHDGMRIDAEGYLWSAVYGEGLVLRIDPGGRTVDRIELPAPNPTCMAFGGPDLATLFITTAAENTDLDAHPQAGSVFAVDLEVAGRPVPVFGSRTPLGPGA